MDGIAHVILYAETGYRHASMDLLKVAVASITGLQSHCCAHIDLRFMRIGNGMSSSGMSQAGAPNGRSRRPELAHDVLKI